MRVVFDFYFGEAPLYLEAARILKERHGWHVAGFSGGSHYKEFLSKHSIQSYDFASFLENGWQSWTPSPKRRQKVEETYGKDLWPGLWGALLADRFLGDKGFDEGWRLVEGHLAYWEDVLNKEEPDAVIGPGVATLTHLACHAVCTRRGIPFVNFILTRVPNGRFVACANLDDMWESVMVEFEKLRSTKAGASDLQRAREFISEFRQKQIQPEYMSYRIQSPGLSFWRLKEFIRRVWALMTVGRNPFDYLSIPPWTYVSEGLIRLAKIRMARLTRIFEKSLPDEPFIYYPLHVDPEASTLVLAPFHVDQAAWIENLAKAIPAGHRLYVKEHPSAVGRRSRSFYKRIKRLAPVRLLAPEISSHELVRKADLTVTMAGTAGWEAILYGRKVVVLGNVFYKWPGLTSVVDQLKDLPSILKKALSAPSPNPDVVAMFVEAIFRGSHEGTIAIPRHHPPAMEPENIEKVVQGILKEMTGRLTDRSKQTSF